MFLKHSKCKDEKRQFFYYCASLFISFLAAVFLSVEYYLSLNGSSLCHTEACEIVSKYLTIEEQSLLAAGAIFFWLVFLLLFLSRKYQNIFYLLSILLFLSLSFDGVLIGFQFFTIQQKCTICFTVALILLLVSVTFSLSNKTYLLIFCFLFSWIGGFSANKILTIPQPFNAYEKMAFLQVNATAGTPTIIATLIFSMHCPHCFEVISGLESKYSLNSNVTWRFAITDIDSDSQMKATEFMNRMDLNNNPFSVLKTIKASVFKSNVLEKSSLHSHSKDALSFLSNSGINIVPTLVVEKSKGHKTILTGQSEILNFFNNY